MKVIFTGGGSAGHIYPLIAVIREMRKNYSDPDLDLYYFGPKNESIATMFSAEGLKIKSIPSGKFRRYISARNILDAFIVPFGIIKSLFVMFFLAPDVVFSKGGHGSFTTVFAARLLQVPIFLHESDAVAGIAAKMQARWAVEVFTSFENTERIAKDKIVCVGNPIRTVLLEGNKEKAKEIFKLQGGKPLLLILGGSQGSRNINNTILEILPNLLTKFEIIHQTGQKTYKQTSKEASILAVKELTGYYHAEPFLNEKQLSHALVACDFIISRAGSGAIFEIAAAGKPSLLIPLPKSAQDHQLKNAYHYQEYGATETLEEGNLKPHFLLEKIDYIFKHPEILESMKQGAIQFARPKVAKIIANYLLEFLYRSFVPVKGK